MWFKVTITRNIEIGGKVKTSQEIYLSDTDNFAEAGYNVMQYFNGECEVESVQLLKTLKPLANDKTSENNKLYIVKIAEDFKHDDGTITTLKYPVPFYANNNEELQRNIADYMEQGFDSMRVTTISETKWNIV